MRGAAMPTTQLSFALSDISMWGGDALDKRFSLFNWATGDAGSWDPSIAGVGLSFDWRYSANFSIDARLNWDLGHADVTYSVDTGVSGDQALILNDVVHLDTSAWAQTDASLQTVGLDWANLSFDLGMTYGAQVGFTDVAFTAAGADLVNSGPINIFNLPTTTNQLFYFNLGDYLNGTLPYYFDSGLIDLGININLDPLVTADSAGEQQGNLDILTGSGRLADPVFHVG